MDTETDIDDIFGQFNTFIDMFNNTADDTTLKIIYIMGKELLFLLKKENNTKQSQMELIAVLNVIKKKKDWNIDTLTTMEIKT